MVKIVAAFDFDGTLTKRDSLPSFLCYLFGSWRTALVLGLELPSMLAFVCGWTTRQRTKEKILKRFFKNININDLRVKGEEFALGPLQNLVCKEGLEKLRWHLEQGHMCVLVSANLDVYLEPWCKSVGFHYAVCSLVDPDEVGKLRGLNCWGSEKVRRLTELLGSKDTYTLYAYGDSLGDRELLELADHSFFRRF